MGILEIYLIGVLLTGGVYNFNECHPTPKTMTSTECAVLSTVTGIGWPIILPLAIHEKVSN